ncbi:MAG: polysaccharide deacetylase family protein [Ginsengibacter sp.]
MKNQSVIFSLIAFLVAGSCTHSELKENVHNSVTTPEKSDSLIAKVADNETIMARKEVPILCYHNIHDFRRASDRAGGYDVTPAAFAEQMQALADSGYQTILPDQLYEYLAGGAKIPQKPVMVTFDDTHEEHFTIGNVELKKHGFKGAYFVMTISINRPRYMNKEQIRQLSDEGNAVCCHTWDHHMVTKYIPSDWDTQLVKPQKQLESIIGKPVQYFAYPFGLWNEAAIPELKSRGYKLAFILSSSRDSSAPLYTVRRMLVPGAWTTPGMLKAMKSTFHL